MHVKFVPDEFVERLRSHRLGLLKFILLIMLKNEERKWWVVSDSNARQTD